MKWTPWLSTINSKDYPTKDVLEKHNLLFPNPQVPDTKQITKESKKSTPNSEQIAGNHYRRCVIQPWDYTIANDLDYFQGSIIKYVTRWKDKGWIEDLKKARHFLDKYIETMEEKYPQLEERPVP